MGYCFCFRFDVCLLDRKLVLLNLTFKNILVIMDSFMHVDQLTSVFHSPDQFHVKICSYVTGRNIGVIYPLIVKL